MSNLYMIFPLIYGDKCLIRVKIYLYMIFPLREVEHVEWEKKNYKFNLHEVISLIKYIMNGFFLKHKFVLHFSNLIWSI